VDAQGNVMLQLAPDRVIEGRIIDLEAHPVSGMSVTVRGVTNRILGATENQMYPPADYVSLLNPAGVMEMPPVVTDANGHFVIRGLGENRWASLEFHHEQFALRAPRIATRQAPPTGAAGAVGSSFELIAAPAMSVSGVVRDAGTHKPLAGAGLESPVDWSRHGPQAITDELGRYQINGLPRGSVQVMAWSLNEPYVPAYSEVKEGAGRGPLTIDFDLHKGLWIHGKVSSQADGAPVPATIEYRPLLNNPASKGTAFFQMGWGLSPLNAQTQPDGTYRVAVLPGEGILSVRTRDGRYRTGAGFDQIKHPHPDVTAGRFNAAREINLTDQATVGAADFLLDPGNSLRVTCVDPEGKALAVNVMGQSADRTGFTELRAGSFDATGLSQKEGRLLYIINRDRKLGKAIWLSPEQIAGEKLLVKLEPMATISGRLVSADGDPIRNNLILANVVVDPSTRSETGVLAAFSDRDGRFKLDLPAGCNFKISAAARSPATYGLLKKDFSVVSGTNVDLGDVHLDE